MNKRLDDADLSGLNIPEKYHSETWVGKGGNLSDQSSGFCKILVTGKWEKYFVWFWRGEIYDPYGADMLRKTQETLCKLTVVPKGVFQLYFKYLKTKNMLYLNRARRLYKESI